MNTESSASQREEQLLGEIETEIVGSRHYAGRAGPGESVMLKRESNPPQDNSVIRIVNQRHEPVGYLPGDLAYWLAPLVDSGKLSVEGRVRDEKRDRPYREERAVPLALSVYSRGGTEELLAKRVVNDRQDAVHEVVREAYADAQQYTDPARIVELAAGLEPLKRQELLPETRLLLALLPGLAREIVAGRGLQAMNRLHDEMRGLMIGQPIQCRNLTLFPLTWKDSHDPPYVLLSEAIKTGLAVVEDSSARGSVRELCLRNTCHRPILIPEGEILIGSKQNRMVNVPVLAAANSAVLLPVSCVERGRWEYDSRESCPAYCAPPSLRSKKLRSVQRSRAAHGAAHSNQHEIWEEVDRGLRAANAYSLTDGFDHVADKLRKDREHFVLPEAAAGMLVARGTGVLGVDLFDCPATLHALWERLSTAYFFDGLRGPHRCKPADVGVAESFLNLVNGAARPRVPSLGLGDELEIAGHGVVGGALLFEGQLCHLAAFGDEL